MGADGDVIAPTRENAARRAAERASARWHAHARGTIPLVRRAARILFNTLTGLSLLLCVAAVALWVRGYRASGAIYYRDGGPLISLDSRRGTFALVVQHHHQWQLRGFQVREGQNPPVAPVREYLRRGRNSKDWTLLGFSLLRSDAHWVLTAPSWFVVTAAAALPAWRLLKRRGHSHSRFAAPPAVCRD